jgi:hypothetical protein
MASVLYQDYLIVASSQRVETTGKWGIWVGVYWASNGQRLYQVFNRLTDTFDTTDERRLENDGWSRAMLVS